VGRWGTRLRRLETGRIQYYLYSVVLGLLVLSVIMLFI
jgi:hypothetical protein